MEQDFPRGGTLVTRSKKEKTKVANENLFKSELFEMVTRKKRKSIGKKEREEVIKKRRKEESEEFYLTKSVLPTILMKKHMAPDMLILGCIKHINDFDLVVSLPNGQTGVVPITNISDAYTSQLQALAMQNEAALDQQHVASLSELFYVGQLVRTKICQLPIQDGDRRQLLKLSINPKDVNSAWSITKLSHGVVLSACVSNEEDHGYVLDLGIPGIHCFLPRKEASSYIKAYNDGKPLQIGSYLLCKVTSEGKLLAKAETRTVKVTINPALVYKSTVKENMNITLDTLLPGMIVEGTVTKIFDYGLEVRFLSYNGTVNRSHLQESTTAYDVDVTLRLAVLYTETTSQVVSLSELSHLTELDTNSRCPFGQLTVGDLIKDASVSFVDRMLGVIFKLKNNITARAQKRHIPDTEDGDWEKTFKLGSKHKCRVIGFDYLDRVALVSLKESDLEKEFIDCSLINIGQVIECKIVRFCDTGVLVRLSSDLLGFVPNHHMTDVPLRQPEKKFSIGDKIQCKVLSIDKERHFLFLTHKKSLLSSKYPDLTDYSQCAVGIISEGTIMKILDKGLVVRFLADVRGFVPSNDIRNESKEPLDKLFYVGQVVCCIIKFWNPESRKLILSLKIAGSSSMKNSEEAPPKNVEFGKPMDCEILGKSRSGLKVKIIPSGNTALIPTAHLSDHHNNCQLLLDMYEVGDVIKGAIYWSITKITILTLKRSLIEAYQNDNILKKFEELQPGLLVPGVVRKRESYGLFIVISPTMWGLCPCKYISDELVNDPPTLFKEGQSVTTKIIEVDREKERFLLSLRMSDCYHGNIEDGLDLLTSYLEEYERIKNSLKSKKDSNTELCEFSVGQIIQVEVTKVTEFGVLCKHSNGVKGFVAFGNMPGVTCTEGTTVKVVVLFVDLKAKCLELSLDKKLLKAVRNFMNNKFSQVKVGQVIKSEVHLIKDDFILVSLRAHALGQFAYLPARKHENDLFEKNLYVVGQVNSFVVKRVQNNLIIGCLELYQQEIDSLTVQSDDTSSLLLLEEGMIVKAVITSVQDLLLSLRIGKMRGRLHITEVTDTPVQGKNPLKKFKAGDEVTVKILSIKELNRKKKKPVYMGISRPKKWNKFAECTMKESKLQKKDSMDTAKEAGFKVGQKVQAFVLGHSATWIFMTISSTQKGRVHIMNISKTLPVDTSEFKLGCCYKAHILNVDNRDYVELSLLDKPWNITDGAKTIGLVKSINPARGLILQLTGGLLGKVNLVDLADRYTEEPVKDYQVDQCVKCYILSYNSQHQPQCILSLRKSRLKAGGDKSVHDPEINDFSDVKPGSVIRGYVHNTNDNGIFISIGTSVIGRATYKLASDYYINYPEKAFTPGKLVTVKVLSIDTELKHVMLSLLEKDTGEPDQVPLQYRGQARMERKHKQNGEKEDLMKTKRQKLDETADSGLESDTSTELDHKVSIDNPPRLSLNTDFNWDGSLSLPIPAVNKESDSDSDSEEEGEQATKKTKKSKAEQQLEEQKLFEREQMLLSGQCAPQCAADFDRLVLESPDSSLVWLNYMAFHLETAEVEKARAVAERALKTISFREEQEKLNVWVGYLNLENMYGTDDSLKEVFKRALQHNDQLKVYNHLIQIYTKSNKFKQAQDLFQILVKRFSTNKQVWIDFGEFFFELGEAEKARKLMHRSFKSLPANQHVDVIAKFGQFEFRYGEPERGKTIFENLLSSYPKRTDLWSVYIDMVTKLGDLDTIRRLYERVVSMNFSVKKMRFFFKKYLQFEEKYGDEETVKTVKQKALDYVEKRGAQK